MPAARGGSDPTGGDDLLQSGRRSIVRKAFLRSRRRQRQGPPARPVERRRAGEFLATINNWSISLGNAGRYAEAVRLLRQGLEFDPHYEPFAINFAHVYRQWSEQKSPPGGEREHSREKSVKFLDLRFDNPRIPTYFLDGPARIALHEQFDPQAAFLYAFLPVRALKS